MKVTYCWHVFHSSCLSSWFQVDQVTYSAMQTCPYCRTVFDKLTTVEMYDALKSEGTEELSGIRIPLAIKGHRRSNNGNPSADEPLSSSSNLTEIDNRSQLHEPSKSNLVEK